MESAVGEGSLSRYSDKMCEEGITDSAEYLKKALEHVEEKGYRINNVSIGVEGKTPKIEPVAKKIKEKISKIAGIPIESVGITATSGEGMTAFGRGEGVQVLAIVSLTKK